MVRRTSRASADECPDDPTPPSAAERFRVQVWPHRSLVLRAARLLAGPNDADDLAQETLMRAFAAISSFSAAEDGTGVKAWLLRILRNVQIDRARHAARRIDAGRPLPDELPDDPPRPETPAETLADLDALLQQFSDSEVIHALQSLPPEIAWTLILVDVEDLGHAAAAEVMDVPVGTVKSRASRGRQMLRERLIAAGHRSTQDRSMQGGVT